MNGGTYYTTGHKTDGVLDNAADADGNIDWSQVPYTKINPFADSMEPMMESMGFTSTFRDMLGEFSGYLDAFSVFSELISNQKSLNSNTTSLRAHGPKTQNKDVSKSAKTAKNTKFSTAC